MNTHDKKNGYFFSALRHENIHALFRNLQAKGVSVQDELDTHTEVSGEEIELAKIAPHWDKVFDPMPVDSYIAFLLNFIETLRAAIAKLSAKPANQPTLRQLAESMGAWETRLNGIEFNPQSRGMRNKNPLNIKYVGQALAIGKDDQNHCICQTLEDGWTLAVKDLALKAGKIPGKVSATGLNGESTIKDLIFRWAEESQQSYLSYVCQKLNIGFSFKLKNFI